MVGVGSLWDPLPVGRLGWEVGRKQEVVGGEGKGHLWLPCKMK